MLHKQEEITDMAQHIKYFADFLGDESGTTAIEYAVIASLVSVFIVGAVTALGTGVNDMFTTVTTELN